MEFLISNHLCLYYNGANSSKIILFICASEATSKQDEADMSSAVSTDTWWSVCAMTVWPGGLQGPQDFR